MSLTNRLSLFTCLFFARGFISKSWKYLQVQRYGNFKLCTILDSVNTGMVTLFNTSVGHANQGQTVQPLFSQHQECREHTWEHTGPWKRFGLTRFAFILKLSIYNQIPLLTFFDQRLARL